MPIREPLWLSSRYGVGHQFTPPSLPTQFQPSAPTPNIPIAREMVSLTSLTKVDAARLHLGPLPPIGLFHRNMSCSCCSETLLPRIRAFSVHGRCFLSRVWNKTPPSLRIWRGSARQIAAPCLLAMYSWPGHVKLLPCHLSLGTWYWVRAVLGGPFDALQRQHEQRRRIHHCPSPPEC